MASLHPPRLAGNRTCPNLARFLPISPASCVCRLLLSKIHTRGGVAVAIGTRLRGLYAIVGDPYGRLRDRRAMEATLMVIRRSGMNDLICLAAFGGCVAATFGLAWLCRRLEQPGGGAKEARK